MATVLKDNVTCACGAKGYVYKASGVSSSRKSSHAKIAGGCGANYVHVTLFGTHCVNDGKRV